jgi:YggT family protein
VFVLGNLIHALANLIDLLLNAYLLIVIARAVLSWVNPDPYNPIVRFIIRVTEPVLGPIRDRLRLPTVTMGLDLSPMVVLLAIYFLKSFLVGSLHDIAASLR